MNPDPGPGVMNISLKFAVFFFKKKKNFQNIFLLFMIFIPTITEHFHNLSAVQILVLGANYFFYKFGLIFCTKMLDLDPDPDPGSKSQNAVDPTDPKWHVVFSIFLVKIFFHFSFLLISLNTHHRKPFR